MQVFLEEIAKLCYTERTVHLRYPQVFVTNSGSYKERIRHEQKEKKKEKKTSLDKVSV